MGTAAPFSPSSLPTAAAPMSPPIAATPAIAAAAGASTEAVVDTPQPASAVATAPAKPVLPSVNNGQQIRITNNTLAKVKSLSILAAKSGGRPYNLVENLDPFKAASAPLPAKGGCVYNIRGQFSEGSPFSIDNIDLCADPTINITVW